MSILSDLLSVWKTWAEGKGKLREEIADYLEVIAKNVGEIATAFANAAKAMSNINSTDQDSLQKVVLSLDNEIEGRCWFIQRIYADLSLVIKENDSLRESLICRLAIVNHSPRKAYAEISSILTETDIPQLRQRITELYKEAGELKAIATTYRVTGEFRDSRTSSQK